MEEGWRKRKEKAAYGGTKEGTSKHHLNYQACLCTWTDTRLTVSLPERIILSPASAAGGRAPESSASRDQVRNITVRKRAEC